MNVINSGCPDVGTAMSRIQTDCVFSVRFYDRDSILAALWPTDHQQDGQNDNGDEQDDVDTDQEFYDRPHLCNGQFLFCFSSHNV